jgi:hypothetical protein
MSFIGILFSMQDSKLDVTIGPYETYEDKLFGYKVIIGNQALGSINNSNPQSMIMSNLTYLLLLENVSID